MITIAPFLFSGEKRVLVGIRRRAAAEETQGFGGGDLMPRFRRNQDRVSRPHFPFLAIDLHPARAFQNVVKLLAEPVVMPLGRNTGRKGRFRQTLVHHRRIGMVQEAPDRRSILGRERDLGGVTPDFHEPSQTEGFPDGNLEFRVSHFGFTANSPDMPSVHVNLSDRSYEVIVEPGLLRDAGRIIAESGVKPCKVAVISDSTVASFHSDALLASLSTSGFVPTLHVVPAGEASKSLAHVEDLCREMTRENHDRKSLVVALGGGVVGDLAGFVASIFYRGISFVQIPTTIVSQVDSSVGGKTGVNIPEGKNLVGAFHQPKLVIVDPETLRTLPDREFHEGFAEAIKHAAIRDADMLADLATLDPADRNVPADLIARNIAIKARIVEADEFETLGQRALLNFGHTIGHGIEASVPYGKMLHGEAISLGLRAALFLSEKRSTLRSEQSAGILDLLERFHLPLALPEEIATDTVLEKLARDKKFSSGDIRFVLLDEPGNARISKEVSKEDLREAIDHLRTPR
jgi:3-dehydroquinate synthase